jgi:hypothetical protein
MEFFWSFTECYCRRYDISTGDETQITSGGRAADIYGNYVVYTNNYYGDLAHQNDGIYLYDLNPEAKKLKVIFATDVTSGSAPMNVFH